jgi:hypothetical protein
MREAHDQARAQYERLRLTTSSLRAQEDARYALRYAYGLLRLLDGDSPREDEVQTLSTDQRVRRLTGARRHRRPQSPAR